ncbi:hypothetical protein [Streptomyces sp. TR06-5]|uniref:hypothetical protein n=1 Tax=Streptomyces sp. TR06-5 TaxID=3385976 RepID=UPI0039A2E90D
MSASSGPGPRGTRTALVCSVADQGVTALTNIAVLLVAARRSTADGFAVFSVVYLVFTVLLGLTTAYVGQALVLERGSAQGVRTACRSAVSFTGRAAVAVAIPAAVLLFPAVGPGRPLAGGLLGLALVLPVVLLQDSLRYAFSALRLPHLALTADLLRLLAALAVLTAQPHRPEPFRLVTAWGLSALPALVVGLLLLAPRLKGAAAEPSRHLRRGHLGKRFAVEFAVGNAGTQLAVVGLGLWADALAVGALRGATALFGPLNVLFNAANGFGPPLLSRVGGEGRTARVAAATGAVFACTAAAWAVVLAILPDTVGEMLLGATWAASSSLLPATGSQYAVMGLGTCALLSLRVLRPRATLPLQVVFSTLSVGLLLGGYLLGGVTGAAWGLCAGSAAKAVAGWSRTHRVVRAASLSATTGAGTGGRS